MKLFKRTGSLLFFALLYASAPSALADSECSKGLVPNTLDFNSESALHWAYLELMSDSQRIETKKKGGFAYLDVIRADGSLDKNRFRQIATEKKYSLDQSNRVRFVLAHVPDPVRIRFFECVENTQDSSEFDNFSQRALKIMQIGTVTGSTLRLAVRLSAANAGMVKADKLVWQGGPEQQALVRELNRSDIYNRIGSPGSGKDIIDITVNDYDSTKDFALFVKLKSQNYIGELKIPRQELMLASLPNNWWDKRWSLPLMVTAHLAHIGNRCNTVNTIGEKKNEFDGKPWTEWSTCEPSGDWSKGGQIQEFSLDWDPKAWSSFQLPIEVPATESLSFQYKCLYAGGSYNLVKIEFPGGGKMMPRGAICGKENGTRLGNSPLLRSIAIELTGSLKEYFKLSYRCSTHSGASIGPVVEGAWCGAGDSTFINSIAVEIDTVGK